MSEIKYKYAYIDDDRDKVISIDEITDENREQYKYRCIGCGHELSPKAISSKCKAPHFCHKKEQVNCSGETYLHKLTKRVIKEKFDKGPTFFVEYETTKVCSNNDCKYRNPRCIEGHIPYRINLKKYIDTCTEEAFVEVKNDRYIADILLTHSEYPDRKLLIEVCVSHPCEKDKISSHRRIIEIKIREEEDVFCLQKNDVIRSQPRKVIFHSFVKEQVKPFQVKLQRYVFSPQQYINGYLTEIGCRKAHIKLHNDSFVELNIINKENCNRNCSIEEVLQWMAIYKGLRRCNLCNYYYPSRMKSENKKTCLFKEKNGIIYYPQMDDAERCENYQEVCLYNLKDFVFEEVKSSLDNNT